MGLISSQSQMLLNQLDNLLCQLKDCSNYDMHGTGIHDQSPSRHDITISLFGQISVDRELLEGMVALERAVSS